MMYVHSCCSTCTYIYMHTHKKSLYIFDLFFTHKISTEKMILACTEETSCMRCKFYSFHILMLEPASAAIGCYIVSKAPKILGRPGRNKVWVKRHRAQFADLVVDEFSPFVLDQLNSIIHYHATPIQIFLICSFLVCIVCLGLL